VAWQKQHFHSAVVALGRGALVLCVFALAGTPARGSDPQSYTVAIDATLRDEFDPPKNFAHDAGVNNPARNNHDLTGYLSVALVRTAVVAATGT